MDGKENFRRHMVPSPLWLLMVCSTPGIDHKIAKFSNAVIILIVLCIIHEICGFCFLIESHGIVK